MYYFFAQIKTLKTNKCCLHKYLAPSDLSFVEQPFDVGISSYQLNIIFKGDFSILLLVIFAQNSHLDFNLAMVEYSSFCLWPFLCCFSLVLGPVSC